jgi:hypothetical protein
MSTFGRRAVKKPVEVGYMKWDGTTEGATAIINAILELGGLARHMNLKPVGTNALHVYTLEGIMSAFPGYYIIQGVKGEFYPCKPDIFEATYDLPSTVAPPAQV